MGKNYRQIGFTADYGKKEEEGSRDEKKPRIDPRVEAFKNAFAYVENPELADELFTMADIRKQFSAFPFKDTDPLPRLLEKLYDEGFHIQYDIMNRQVIPVRKISLTTLSISNNE